MELNRYQDIVWSSYFGKTMSLDNQLINNAFGLAGETGEVVDQIKKEIYLDRVLTKEEIIEELGDVLWHLVCMISSRGFTLEEVARHNIDKLRERYPKADWSEVSEV